MTLSYQLLLLIPFLVLGALSGLRRGGRREAITTFGLILVLLFFGNAQGAGVLGDLFNRIVQAFAVFLSVLLDTDLQGRNFVNPNTPGLSQIVWFLFFVLLAYAAGGAFGETKYVSRLAALVGGILGVINAFLVGSQLFTLINQNWPGWFARQDVIVLTPDTGPTGTLRDYLPTIFAILFILWIAYLFLRLPRTRQ
jgi:hypothetical protein